MEHKDARSSTYRGRFAPTPSGPLHAGSLLTAVASWLYARSVSGIWLVRIDDLDRARCPPPNADIILRQLEAHGLYWDEAPYYQSRHTEAYEHALQKLGVMHRLYRCDCTRAVLRRNGLHGPDGLVYDGRCRNLPTDAISRHASRRLRLADGAVSVNDRLLGILTRNVARDIGDFVVQRADGVAAYHLACTVDEQALHISEVVRGADLIGATFCQYLLQGVLQLDHPGYRHLPVLEDGRGLKLSKQNHCPPVDNAAAGSNLCTALDRLGQRPPPDLAGEPPATILHWAIGHWRPELIPRSTRLVI